MSKHKISPKLNPDKLLARLRMLRRYSVVAFVLGVVSLYGFVLLRISSLSTVEPTDNQVNSLVKSEVIPHIDDSVVSQLKTLRDNSVNVKTLFDQARTSPFQ
jgi:hypothetical protein